MKLKDFLISGQWYCQLESASILPNYVFFASTGVIVTTLLRVWKDSRRTRKRLPVEPVLPPVPHGAEHALAGLDVAPLAEDAGRLLPRARPEVPLGEGDEAVGARGLCFPPLRRHS